MLKAMRRHDYYSPACSAPLNVQSFTSERSELFVCLIPPAIERSSTTKGSPRHQCDMCAGSARIRGPAFDDASTVVKGTAHGG